MARMLTTATTPNTRFLSFTLPPPCLSRLSHRFVLPLIVSLRSWIRAPSPPFSSLLDPSGASAPTRIQRVPKSVSQQVECERQQDQEDSGVEHHPPGHREELSARGIGQHAAERRRRLGDAHPEEGQCRLEQDVG